MHVERAPDKFNEYVWRLATSSVLAEYLVLSPGFFELSILQRNCTRDYDENNFVHTHHCHVWVQDSQCRRYFPRCLFISRNEPCRLKSSISRHPPQQFLIELERTNPENYLVLYSPRLRWPNQVLNYGVTDGHLVSQIFFYDYICKFAGCRTNISSLWHASPLPGSLWARKLPSVVMRLITHPTGLGSFAISESGTPVFFHATIALKCRYLDTSVQHFHKVIV